MTGAGGPRTLVVLSFNRSGSNYLSDLLAALPFVASQTEVFNPRAVQVHSFQDGEASVRARLHRVAAQLGVDLPDPAADLRSLMTHPPLVARVRAEPLAAIACLAAYNARPLSALKIFPHHLPVAAVDRLLGDPRILPCALLRNPLDTFISMEKRRLSGAFRGVDTTALRPVLSPRRYRRFLRGRVPWLDLMRRHRHRLHLALSYEALVALPDDAARATALRRHLGDFDQGAPLLPIRPAPPQDRAGTWSDKIANAGDFARGCADLGLVPGADLAPWPEPLTAL
ncbi:sulfotransferase [Roseicyclus persicicus]|uniref:Sulfotransferase n=1 Tax=Roseicyclus persicicus TaxID=2650661 RepID=A0A7X6H1G5_9RHOB|nr:sulfotransferase [Roseibacterium persicicum]NKX46321.1 sulfotransferase [Roseibacterium persicicum]